MDKTDNSIKNYLHVIHKSVDNIVYKDNEGHTNSNSVDNLVS